MINNNLTEIMFWKKYLVIANIVSQWNNIFRMEKIDLLKKIENNIVVDLNGLMKFWKYNVLSAKWI